MWFKSSPNGRLISNTLYGLFFFFVLFLPGQSFGIRFFESVTRLKVLQVWQNVELNLDSSTLVELRDDVPDFWVPTAWNGATRRISLDKNIVFDGQQAVQLNRTNNVGTVALIQTVSINHSPIVTVSAYARGDGGAIQTRFRDFSSGTWVAQGWQEIAPSDEWVHYVLSIPVPPQSDSVELRLRTNRKIWFDAVTLTSSVENNGKDKLLNSNFEVDGIDQLPLEWWMDAKRNSKTLGVGLPSDSFLSYSNMVDMIHGNFEAIKQRAEGLGLRCVYRPDMVNWLLALGFEQREINNPTAAEQIFRLAVQLAPECPQPYAALGSLYEANKAFEQAVVYYKFSADVAGQTPYAGQMYFRVGLVCVRYLGDSEEAVQALLKARQLSGWENSAWAMGAASLNLGIAYETLGAYDEAKEAYEAVLDCERCLYNHPNAVSRLDQLP